MGRSILALCLLGTPHEVTRVEQHESTWMERWEERRRADPPGWWERSHYSDGWIMGPDHPRYYDMPN